MGGVTTLPRREFLRLLGFGIPAAVIEKKFGLWERVRTYFIPAPPPDYTGTFLTPEGFAIPIEWTRLQQLTSSDCLALQLELVQDMIPKLIERDAALDRYLSLGGSYLDIDPTPEDDADYNFVRLAAQGGDSEEDDDYEDD